MSIQPGTYYIVNQGSSLTADIAVHGPKVSIGAQLIASKSDKESPTQKFVVAEVENKSARGMRNGVAYTIQPSGADGIYVAPAGPFSGTQLQCYHRAYSWTITAEEEDKPEGSYRSDATYKIQAQVTPGPQPIPRLWTLVNGQEGEHLVAQVGPEKGSSSWSFVPVDEESDSESDDE